jgi:DNA-binding NarL/FixJ family response regulator
VHTRPQRCSSKGIMHTVHDPIRTLVVDDSPAALHSICYFLKLQPNISVVGTATDGREGLASAYALHPDLVLIDVQMPGMNGIEAASQLKRNLPATRVIMVTVHDVPEVRQACRESGADGFIAKEHLDVELPALLEHIFTCDKSRV